MAIITCFINLKGGVGKTTLCVGLAEFLAGYKQRHVLVIDLDPQITATNAIIGERHWEVLDGAGKTIYQAFLDTALPLSQRRFRFLEALVTRVSTTRECYQRLSLMTTSTRFFNPKQPFTTRSPWVLADVLPSTLLAYFDDVLIDCRPDLELLARNGLALADGIVIPVMPETASVTGIPQLLGQLRDLRTELGRPLPVVGIMVNRYDPVIHNKKEVGNHAQELTRLRQQATQSLRMAALDPTEIAYPPIFDQVMKKRIATTTAMAFHPTMQTLIEKYTAPSWEDWCTLTEEYLARCLNHSITPPTTT